MIIEYTTEKGLLRFKLLPNETTSYNDTDYKGYLSIYLACGVSSERIKLEEGEFLIGLTSEVTEEQAKMMGFDYVYDGRDDENIKGLIYECFDDSDFTCDNALDSFKSIMQHLQVYDCDPFKEALKGESKENSVILNSIKTLHPNWDYVDSRTGKWIVLFKPNEK